MRTATIGKLAILAGAPLLSGLAFAAPPAGAPSFGEWTVTDGVIDACGTARTNIMSCQVLVKDQGFMQVQVKDAEGNSYVQSILTDYDATGTPGNIQDGTTASTDLLAFYDENYIRINFQDQASTIAAFTYGDPGFMGVQVINDNGLSSTRTWFEATTKIATGWGIDILTPDRIPANTDGTVKTVVELTTDFWTTGVWGTAPTGYVEGTYNGMFDTSFAYVGLNDGQGRLVGRDLYIDQDLSLATANDAPDDTSGDRQTFYFWDRSGELLNAGVDGVWGRMDDNPDNVNPLAVDDNDDFFTGLGSQLVVNWGAGNDLPPSTDPGIEGSQLIAFWIDQEVTTQGFGNDGKSTFYHLQVDGTGAYDDVVAYSQAGTGFADVYLTEVVDGTVQYAMGGLEDWLGTSTSDNSASPENQFFPPPKHLRDVALTVGEAATTPVTPHYGNNSAAGAGATTP